MDRCQSGLSTEAEYFGLYGHTTSDREQYEEIIRPTLELVREIEQAIDRRMLELIESGHWIAFGRRGPDTAAEVIPKRYWPFLEMDIERATAKGQGMEFRGLLFLELARIPTDDPVLGLIETANKLPSSQMGAPTPITGAPGRPTSMHLVEAEFQRRAGAGLLNGSLRTESDHLAKWLANNHLSMPQTTSKTIQNRIRAKYKNARN
ncbi:hypothetical protein ASD50_18355 [Mesorhizobium sp. Root552]|nr:hypothetical protein ASD50_18355 [Mesorhizobium sp. Root552]